MNTKITKVYAKTDKEGNLILIGPLTEWAREFNKTHRLIPAKGVKQ